MGKSTPANGGGQRSRDSSTDSTTTPQQTTTSPDDKVVFEGPVFAYKHRMVNNNWQIRHLRLFQNGDLQWSRGQTANLSGELALASLPPQCYYAGEEVQRAPDAERYFPCSSFVEPQHNMLISVKQSLILSDPFKNRQYAFAFQNRVDYLKFLRALQREGYYKSARKTRESRANQEASSNGAAAASQSESSIFRRLFKCC